MIQTSKKLITIRAKRQIVFRAPDTGSAERHEHIEWELSHFGTADEDAKEEEAIEDTKIVTKRHYSTRHYLCYSCRKELSLRIDDKHYGQPVLFCGHKCLMTFLNLVKWEDVKRMEQSNDEIKSEMRL